MTSLETGRQTLGDRYELQELIARGGMGQVWRGRDRLLLRPVAVKVLRSEYADDPVFLERFRCEARHAAALSHPNIAAVLDYGESDDEATGEHLAYLVMELVDGAPLSDRLSTDGPLEPEAALSVLQQTAAGLAEAHRAGLVHRDVKPANILVRPDGRVKLTDFGIAWSAESVPLTGTGQVIGTARYMSPEQAAGDRVSPASDVYALGLVGYESLTGHAPFDGTNPVTVALKQVREAPEPLPEDVPPGVRSLIDAALVKDPGERLPDADAFLTAVEETIEQTARPRPGAPSPSRAVAAAPSAALVETAAVTVPSPEPVSPDDLPPGETAEVSGASRSPRRRPAVLVPVLAVLLAGLLAVLLWPGGSGGGQPPAQAAETGAGTGEGAAAAGSVVLAANDHVGRPADDVAADLTALGLTVQRQDEVTTAVEPGTVSGLDPVGVPLQPGAPVTLRVAVTPAAPAPAPEGGAPAGGEGPEAALSVPSGSGPAAPAPAEPAPAEPGPSDAAVSPDAASPEPAPAEPAPAEPAPSDAAPSDAAPSDAVSSEPAPSEPAPSDSVPTEPAPTDPTGPAPTEPAPSDSAPTEPAPTDPTGAAPSEPSEPAPSEPSEPAPSGSSGATSPGSATSSAPDGGSAAPDTGAAG
ncbi:protein kinase domain-containing protein [Geodermatophilus sp. SYSU D00696]